METYDVSLKTLLDKTYWDKNQNKGKRVPHYTLPQPNILTLYARLSLKPTSSLPLTIDLGGLLFRTGLMPIQSMDQAALTH